MNYSVWRDVGYTMLKHCSTSSLDIRGRVSPDKEIFDDGKCKGRISLWDSLEKPRMCVSLLYLDKDQTILLDRREPHSISLSTKYGKTRTRQFSGPSSSVFSANCRVFESIRVYARCLRSDIEYRTMRITRSTTAHQLIQELLAKFKLKHVDPKLFYLTMEVTIESLKRTVIKMADDDKLARLLHCNPWADSRIILRSKAGGFIKVYDTVVMQDSVYKSIKVSYDTTVQEVILIVLACCNSDLPPEKFCLLEVTKDISRLMLGEEKPLLACKLWGLSCKNRFVMESANVEVGVDATQLQENYDLETSEESEGSDNESEESSENSESSLGSLGSLDSGFWTLLH